jgi:hypothetical protein
MSCPAIYGADVSACVTDSKHEAWNLSKLGCILDMVKENNESEMQVDIFYRS